MEFLSKWLQVWAMLFFTWPLIIIGFALAGCFCYSFIVWDFEPWTHPVEILKMLNPLAHTWSRVALLTWTVVTGFASNGLSQL